jgi:hypothetical protein
MGPAVEAQGRRRIEDTAGDATGRPCRRAIRLLWPVVSLETCRAVPNLLCFRHTHEQNQPVGWRFSRRGTLYLEKPHARHNWADKVDVEDGEYVGKMEDQGNRQEASSWEGRHGAGCARTRRQPALDIDRRTSTAKDQKQSSREIKSGAAQGSLLYSFKARERRLSGRIHGAFVKRMGQIPMAAAGGGRNAKINTDTWV